MPPKHLSNPTLKSFKPDRDVADVGPDTASRANNHGGKRKSAGRRPIVYDSVSTIRPACESVQERLRLRMFGPRYVREWRDRLEIIAKREPASQLRNAQTDYDTLIKRINSNWEAIRVSRKEVLSTVAAHFHVSPATVDRYWKRYKKRYKKKTT